MGLDEATMIVAGIGFRRGAEAFEITALIQRALAEAGIAPSRLAAIATAHDRAGDAAIRDAASAFGLVPEGIAPDALLACDARVPTRSARIEALRGVGSLCEAAALACAGPDSRLVLDRIASGSGSVTCALAFRPETRQRAEG